ncbi:MAG: hypothetical protein IH943_11345 [Acidobacteria bacterium]|nr:hypothetical protein [Acidobacteriota bacterium]
MSDQTTDEGSSVEEGRRTLDDVVAANFKRLTKDYKAADLAKAIGVHRTLIYDMRGPREGRSQRQFLWSDLVAICAALDIDLYELALPPDDGESVAPPYESAQSGAMTRDTLSYHLFGIPLGRWTPELVADLRDQIQRQRRTIATEYRNALQKMADDTARLQRAYQAMQSQLDAIHEADALIEEWLAEEE